jgi:hypothetical protein
MAPFHLGLVVTLALLMAKLTRQLLHVVPDILSLEETDVIPATSPLVDLTPAGSLLLILALVGYESTVSRLDAVPAERRAPVERRPRPGCRPALSGDAAPACRARRAGPGPPCPPFHLCRH